MRNNLISDTGEARVDANVSRRMKKVKTKAKRIQEIKIWQVSVCLSPSFHIATGPCLLGRSLEACLCYRYRTFSAWVQWEHSGSLSQIGFKWMFASPLLSLASFSHWLLQQRLSLVRKENDAPSLKRTRSFHGTENIECVQWGCSKLFRESQMQWSTWGPQTSHYEQTLKNVHNFKKST